MRKARFRSVYINGVPVWVCSRCGTRRLPATRHTDLAAHEEICGHWRPDPTKTHKPRP